MKKLKQTLSVFLAVIMLLSSLPLLGLDGIFTMKADATTMKQTIASMSVGDKFTFGSYPQSDVTDTLGTELTAAAPSTDSWNSYNYYYYYEQSDYMKYYDLTYNGERYRGVYFTSYRPNCWDALTSAVDTWQNYNGYNTNTIYWFKYEPLTWRVLDPATGYVICETIIDSQAFNNERYANGSDVNGTAYYNDTTYQHYANNWEYSTIRQWLNEMFYNIAFTSSERSQIPATVHTTPAYSTFRLEYYVGETTDYIFLPTYQDMLNTSYGFSSDYSDYDINRRAHASAYAKAQGAYVSTSYTDSYGENTSYYRLRSAGSYSDSTTNVNNNGNVYNSINDANNSNSGIRPALCFNPSSTGTPTTCTHTWNSGVITKVANCVDTGIKTFTCTSCNAKNQETLPVDSSNHKAIVTLDAVVPTCVATGLTQGSKCTACDTILVAQEETNKLDHKYTVLVEIIPSNCVETGKKIFACTSCNATNQETLPVDSSNHKAIVTLDAVVPTCVATGLTQGSKCTACDTILVAQEVIDALEHNMGEFYEVLAPTCKKSGVDRKDCSREGCDYYETMEYPALGHYDEDNDGRCDLCNKYIGDSLFDSSTDSIDGSFFKKIFSAAINFIIEFLRDLFSTCC